mmetsp:Transcript_24489/g.62227  ORF Transcript_24489/g.62227 Transcript_24489/m.62227 type:complete len:356 (-) Transcript_24489:342-1409(-)
MACTRSSSTMVSAARGTVASASADTGCPPIAHTSPSACTAAICPNRKGSSQKARKKSTDCTSSLPGGGGLMSAASSGAPSPTTTSGRATEGGRRASARDSTDAPTFAPQPPHRILAAATRASASGPAAEATAGGRPSVPMASPPIMPLASISSSMVEYLAMKLRSMESFHPHIHDPCVPSQPLVPTQCLSPVVMRDRNVVWGTCGCSGSPVRKRRMLATRGGPARTANTPALGRGCARHVATSPAAKTSGGPPSATCSVSWVAMNPWASVGSPVSLIQEAAAAWVHHRHSSNATTSSAPPCSFPPPFTPLPAPCCPVDFDSLCMTSLPASTLLTLQFSRTVTPFCCMMAMMERLA